MFYTYNTCYTGRCIHTSIYNTFRERERGVTYPRLIRGGPPAKAGAAELFCWPPVCSERKLFTAD